MTHDDPTLEAASLGLSHPLRLNCAACAVTCRQGQRCHHLPPPAKPSDAICMPQAPSDALLLGR